MILNHAFEPGLTGTYLAAYCAHPREPGTEPLPGRTPGGNCGYPESRHHLPTVTTEEQARAEGDRLAELIYNRRPNR